ncbi:MAG: hypothetical protein GOP50_01995 [Candidatus Heimdallarchaeota archaeon]|nr:hypothetical protein [Candidatus Heimdallarchaeota archaeon]
MLNFTKPGEIVSTTVFYRINVDNWTEVSMVKESYNYFTYNLGSSFSTNDNVTFYFKIKTKISTQYLYSVSYSFIVGSEYTAGVTSISLLSSLGLLTLVTVLVEKKKRKTRR